MEATRTRIATKMGILDQVRSPLLLVMLVLIPVVFISWGARATPQTPAEIAIPGGDRIATDMRSLMTVIDVPIAIAFLAGLVGVFVVNSALQSDRRLVVAGFTPGEAVVPRLVVLAIAVLVVTVVSLVVMAVWFSPERWGMFIVGNLTLGLEYGAIGALAGALIGRLGAVYLMFFLPNIDIGIAQDPIFFSGEPQGWATVLPGYGGTRVILDASYSTDFDTWGPLLVALGWLVALGILLAVVLRHAVAPRR